MKNKRSIDWFPPGNTFKRKLGFIFCCTGIMSILNSGIAMAQSSVLLVSETRAEEAYGPGIEAEQTETMRIRAIVKEVEDEKILV